MQQTLEAERSAEYIRQYDDVSTWLSEVLRGKMQTSFEYTFDGHELYSHDGLPLTRVFDDAILDAKHAAAADRTLGFEVRRREIERSELDDIFAMARGEGSNTMVVVSDFVPELMNATQDVGGYNVTRKQTMLRVITRTPEGRIKMVSQSLEGSYRPALEALYGHLGFEVAPGELLGQRMYLDLEFADQEFLTDELTGVYDRTLENIHGGDWHAGWNLPSGRAYKNTYDFVLGQRDLLDAYLYDSPEGFDEVSLYGLAAAMRDRYERALQGTNPIPIDVMVGDPLHEMFLAAQLARQSGTVFSGCGLSLGQLEQDSAASELGELGYGNKSNEDEYGSLDFKCQKGHNNTRPKGKLIDNCTTCGISVRC